MDNLQKYQEKLLDQSNKVIAIESSNNSNKKLVIKMKCGHIRKIYTYHVSRELLCTECLFKCSICGKQFKGQSDYNKHRYTHEEKYRKNIPKRYSIEQWQKSIDRFHDDIIVKDIIETGRKDVRLKIGWRTCNHEKEISSFNFNRNLLCLECNPKPPTTFSSRSEVELLNFVKSLGFNARKTYVNEFLYELDIYIPELKIAFEYNGTFWHSVNPTTSKSKIPMGRLYHRNKQDFMYKNYGIKVYYLWEYWGLDKCKNLIKAKLSKTKKVYGPKLEIVEVSSRDKKSFFERYHVDNDCKSCYNVGFKYKGELISVMSFRPNKDGLEIARLATLPGYSVIEGPSTLLKKGIEYANSNGYNKIISYCLRDVCPDYHDSVYYKIGFKFIYDAGPTMKYFNKNDTTVYPRQKYQKFKLKELFPQSFSTSKREVDILAENKIYPIYDSGNWRFELYL